MLSATAAASPNVMVVSVVAEDEACSAAYRIPGLLYFEQRLFAVATAGTQGT